jgi:hypothetical protein
LNSSTGWSCRPWSSSTASFFVGLKQTYKSPSPGSFGRN